VENQSRLGGGGSHPVVESAGDTEILLIGNRKGKEKYRLLDLNLSADVPALPRLLVGNEPSHDMPITAAREAPTGRPSSGTGRRENSTSPICSFPTNAFGLCDIHGNVYQWIEDCYETDIAKLPTDGSAIRCGNCAVRGFRSNSFESNSKTLRSANRAFVYAPNTRGRNYLGFRVAKTIQ
jgi:formylglycine-generating enzyme required for sulfatase activity